MREPVAFIGCKQCDTVLFRLEAVETEQPGVFEHVLKRAGTEGAAGLGSGGHLECVVCGNALARMEGARP